MNHQEKHIPTAFQQKSPSSFTSQENIKTKRDWKKWIVPCLMVALLICGITYYVFFSKKSGISNVPSPVTSGSPAETSAQRNNLNPNTGNLYSDIKVRLNEVIQ